VARLCPDPLGELTALPQTSELYLRRRERGKWRVGKGEEKGKGEKREWEGGEGGKNSQRKGKHGEREKGKEKREGRE